MSEFKLIDLFFKSLSEVHPATKRDDVLLGIGDDCALLNVPVGKQLAVSTDTLISGVHFPEFTSAEDIAYKSLAVNLSDLAAMGAQPAWCSLAITLPDENKLWLENFVKGFAELMVQHKVQLIGGDTTRGALSITVQVLGFVEAAQALRRDKACIGDDIYVSGTIGDAGLGLKQILKNKHHKSFCVSRLNRPSPRLVLGENLLDISCCAIDISDGLLADLKHITQQSQVGAEIDFNAVPVSEELKAYYAGKNYWQDILNAGDDYELCFTAARSQQKNIIELQKKLNIALTCIGQIVEGNEIKCLDENKQPIDFLNSGYNHFNDKDENKI